MHNGMVVLADGYYGSWMTEIIRRLQGHHEPQEERVFASILSFVGEDATMIEVGGYWSYYSLWFLQGFARRSATVIEPDPTHMEVGKTNAFLNDAPVNFIRAFAARQDAAAVSFTTERSGELVTPAINVGALIEREFIVLDILHCDAQGAELSIIESCADAFRQGRVRFAIFSTHARQITGDYLTHQRCLDAIKALGGQVLAEHDVHESFSGDGLIAAHFGRDPISWRPPALSYNRYSTSLFRNPIYDIISN